ncbi:MAG: hypothetical protein AW09_001872 [Candidatus Accumulibacter phosphatis]|uniref:Uncharacterized protein n=1 Tax=Candidatus Accumulibacter phosphatis TaxID=327160 RepID=A0A080LW85_9PROT|nr:MAG: hypothetical protein AW09_001872 [Candidatus Accumulibacter phosphatis]
MDIELTGLHGARHLCQVREHHPLAPGIDPLASGVVETKNDILRRNDDRLAIRWRQDIVGCQHQGSGFHLGFQRQGHVHRHLVTVEVGVECRANQRMQLDRLAFDQRRLEGLDAETV